jgi:fatty acid desaturase
MRQWQDARMLVWLALHYCAAVCAWTLFPFEARYFAPLAVWLAISSWVCALIAHNALHCPVFKSRPASDAFQIALTCAYGFPVSEYLPGHNLSHHRHLQTRADLMRTAKAPFLRVNALNLFFFFPRVALDVFRQNRAYVAAMATRAPAWRRQLFREAAACWGIKALLLVIDWRRAIAFVVLPHLFAVYGITTINLFQHDGCDEKDPLNHSRNFVGKLLNWLTFNNGFHSVHHDTPTLHWSLLPEEHAKRYAGRLSANLEQRSLFVYLVRTYLFTGRRRRFDGAPMGPLETGPDENWIPKPPGPSIAPAGVT